MLMTGKYRLNCPMKKSVEYPFVDDVRVSKQDIE